MLMRVWCILGWSEVWANFSSMLEPTGFGQWLFSLHTTHENSLCGMCRMSTASWSPHPLPAYIWLSTYSHTGTWMLSPNQKLFKPHSLGMFTEASSLRHDQWLTQSLASLPSLQDGGGAKSSKLLIMTWSFWCPATFWSSPGVHQESFHWKRIYSHHSGNYKCFSSFVTGTENQSLNIREKDAPRSTLITQEIIWI